MNSHMAFRSAVKEPAPLLAAAEEMKLAAVTACAVLDIVCFFSDADADEAVDDCADVDAEAEIQVFLVSTKSKLRKPSSGIPEASPRRARRGGADAGDRGRARPDPLTPDGGGQPGGPAPARSGA